MKIDQEVLKHATKCKKNFACVSDKRHALCKVVRVVNREMFFVRCTEDISCHYRTDIDSFQSVCSCPVRQEINRKYLI